MADHGLHARVAPFALAAVALGAAVTSFDALLRLAEHAGWGSPFPAVFLPITLDALAVGAWSVWSTTRSSYARAVGILAVGASILGNVASHAYDRGSAQPSFVTVALVAAVPPLAVILVWLMPRETPTVKAQVKPPTAAPTKTPPRALQKSPSKPPRHAAGRPTPAPTVRPHAAPTLAATSRPVRVTANVGAHDREAHITAVMEAARAAGHTSVLAIREGTGCSHAVAREAARRIAAATGARA